MSLWTAAAEPPGRRGVDNLCEVRGPGSATGIGRAVQQPGTGDTRLPALRHGCPRLFIVKHLHLNRAIRITSGEMGRVVGT